MRQLSIILFMIGAIIHSSYGENNKTIKLGLIGVGEGAVRSIKQVESEIPVEITSLPSSTFEQSILPDLSQFDVILVAFGNKNLKNNYKKAFDKAAKNTPKVFSIGPVHLSKVWNDWLGADKVTYDPILAGYYGLSEKSMRDMIKYVLKINFGYKDLVVDKPDASKLSNFFHPKFKDIKTINSFIEQAKKLRPNIDKLPRIAIGSFRHHINFHQPKVIRELINRFDESGILTLCFVADSDQFQKNLLEFKPDLVVMTSHTREPAAFWKKLNVPRIHSLWFMEESIKDWAESNRPGMNKSGIQHLLISAELRGATECLTAGGTKSGGNCGEEILPIPDRIDRIIERSKAWLNLRTKPNADKKIPIVIYDHQANKANLMCGAHHALNAPKSMIKFLKQMKLEGYTFNKELPKDETELLDWIKDHGRQMGSWEPANLDRMARSGNAVLIPEAQYKKWYNERVPAKQRELMKKNWGEAPGKLMVWEDKGKKFIVLPKIDLGNIVLMTQPPKGEALTANIKFTPDESLMPPTHNFLATYFWMQEVFRADAMIHFGSHGSEWLFPGKQAVMSKADWTDMMIGNIPNINPWLSTNTAELVPCKRRARAVIIDFLPPPLMYADLTNELQNLDSTIDKYKTLDDGVLQKKFGTSITKMVFDNKLDRELEFSNNNLLTSKDVAKVSLYLHDLKNEMIPANMHTLGERPPEDLLIPYLANCIGEEYLTELKPFYNDDVKELNKIAESVVEMIIRDGLTTAEAIKASGGNIEKSQSLKSLQEYLDIALEINKNLDKTPQEISNIFSALNGDFIPPGPCGAPERNPAVVPTGRNLYILNPKELPTKSSWELGTSLIKDYLESMKSKNGIYPKKIAFSLVPYATYNDFGIIESQLLYLMGMKPIWNVKNQVTGVEIIPSKELGRPRIDLFLNARNVYQDELPQMMKLIDKAIKLAASIDEPDNYVFQNSVNARKLLKTKGFSSYDAKILSEARMFGTNPNETIDGHDWFFYLTDRSGEWDSRDDILDVYLETSKYVYTEGMWGEKMPEAYDIAIQGTETILKSWYDNRDYVLGNKFAWFAQGTLSLAIKKLTGREPDYMFVDVRNRNKAEIVDSATVVQRDFRSRLTNPKWIKNMMNEDYAGASKISNAVSNMMGWEVMREKTLDDSNWEDVTDVFVRDKYNLNVREWFDSKNPHAFQKVASTLLETARKGYWKADKETIAEIADAYAKSVVKFGSEQGIKVGGNKKLEKFVGDSLSTDMQNSYNKALEKERNVLKKDDIKGKEMSKIEDKQENNLKSKKDNNNLYIILTMLGIIFIGFVFKRKSLFNRGV